VKTLYVAWQDPTDRRWIPVGRLSFDGDVYRFVYTKGAKQSSSFVPFGRMRQLDTVYESKELFPLFANRLLSKTRPEYKDFLHWLNVQEHEADPFALLARTEGMRATDSLMVFACPEKGNDGTYHAQFFSHGIRYLPPPIIAFIDHLSPHTCLYLMPDPQNPHDPHAIALRTAEPAVLVGYCPRYTTADLLHLLQEVSETVHVTVERVNHDAPLQLRLLCRITADWPNNFHPCSSKLFETLA
jgi:hypothetical protein